MAGGVERNAIMDDNLRFASYMFQLSVLVKTAGEIALERWRVWR